MQRRAAAKTDRREFFRGVGRLISLGLISGAAIASARRRPGFPSACINQEICQGCQVFARCNLPPALSVKRFNPGNPS
jgi:hypothetical protein